MPAKRKPIIVPPEGGRVYPMGRMSSTFKADNAETGHAYSVSEWRLAPNTAGPGTHSHPEDHVYYVLAGTLSVKLAGKWTDAPRGSTIIIPGGTPHDFQNRGKRRAAFLNINTPGGFEDDLPSIVDWFKQTPPGDARTR
jgi:quercetin dioxygenase-like cupin family protein